MPETKIIKTKISRKQTNDQATEPGTGALLRVRAARSHRAASCSRLPQQRQERQERRCGRSGRSPAPGARCAARARSTSAAPGAPELRRNTGPPRERLPGRGRSEAEPGEQRSARPESHSHAAFTVIPPDPNKRREIQRKAEAELAALEELRLSRAMAYVSIDPSRVGGLLSLEEVRMKQQQEMVQAKRNKQIRKVLMEQTPVLICPSDLTT